MKRIKKSLPPNPLTLFYASNPTANWKQFRAHRFSKTYSKVKKIIFEDQNGLCAYCEDYILDLEKDKRRIEHFHDKSDPDISITNWALDWNNVFGVCNGGTHEGSTYPTPENLSCDAHKEHILKSPKTEGVFLNPLEFPFSPSFVFDKVTGHLDADINVCRQLDLYVPNNYGSFTEFVKQTIRILNLNCDRLAQKRLKVFQEYNRLIAKAREQRNPDILKKLPEHWLGREPLAFFTVRRCLLGAAAEEYLIANRAYPLINI